CRLNKIGSANMGILDNLHVFPALQANSVRRGANRILSVLHLAGSPDRKGNRSGLRLKRKAKVSKSGFNTPALWQMQGNFGL
ncbi:hypothetical protein MXD81_23945, partial [Microbacteriaceae bacterium K1510]|nr:hypothetical protein [Microbacteriaceae bacterium K1510]